MKNVTYINAGAGSGKTYTLTKILAEKLSERDENGKSLMMPSQVILTTFTELAAAEFREKARVRYLRKEISVLLLRWTVQQSVLCILLPCSSSKSSGISWIMALTSRQSPKGMRTST